MEKAAFELNLLGWLGLGGWQNGRGPFYDTESSNGKVAQSGNMDTEKQTIQSGWGLESVKGISEAPVGHGTNRSTAQTMHFVKLKKSLLLKLALLKGGLKGTQRIF